MSGACARRRRSAAAFIELDIGLPVRRTRACLVQTVIAGGEPVDPRRITAMERRGRSVRCRVRVSPLLYEDRTSHGAVLFVEETCAEPERRRHSAKT